ncbi:hypothetical protein GCM10023238_03200 [Streptomyces heliomycini]
MVSHFHPRSDNLDPTENRYPPVPAKEKQTHRGDASLPAAPGYISTPGSRPRAAAAVRRFVAGRRGGALARWRRSGPSAPFGRTTAAPPR